jgi:hypothetical protein
VLVVPPHLQMKPSCRFKPKHVRPVSASGDGAVATIADATEVTGDSATTWAKRLAPRRG